eukprot:gene8419-8603_t
MSERQLSGLPMEVRQCHGKETIDADAVLCDYTLRKVLSWLELSDIFSSAALVSRRWHQASTCREVWRRRMHKQILALFCGNVLPGHPFMNPARLFSSLYQCNLLQNTAFLERDNTLKAEGLIINLRRLAWEPSVNAQGMTWAHPFDFSPELPALPAEAVSGLKPFSVGCLATSPGGAGWTEVCSLPTALEAQGVPAGMVVSLLKAELTLELSLYVAGGAIAGGEYQVVFALLSAEDVLAATQQQPPLPLVAVPYLTVPFTHLPGGSAAVAGAAATNLRALGLSSSRVMAKVPLRPTPGEWMRVEMRVTLPSDEMMSHVVVGLRGCASRSRRGHYATKFAAAKLRFVPSDEC